MVFGARNSDGILKMEERKVGFTENTAMRHRRGGGREVTVTSKLHTQEDRDTELNIVIDEVGPGEGRLESWGIEVPFNPAGEGGVAQVPAGSPAQATTCGERRCGQLVPGQPEEERLSD